MSKKSAVSSANVDDDLEWIPVGLSTIQHGETTKEKLIRKFNENPFVPIGKQMIRVLRYPPPRISFK